LFESPRPRPRCGREVEPGARADLGILTVLIRLI
jgi:hypothetical protein